MAQHIVWKMCVRFLWRSPELSPFSVLEKIIVLWNVGIYLYVHVTLQPRRPTSAYSTSWEPQISPTTMLTFRNIRSYCRLGNVKYENYRSLRGIFLKRVECAVSNKVNLASKVPFDIQVMSVFQWIRKDNKFARQNLVQTSHTKFRLNP